MSLTEPTQPPVVGLEVQGPMPQRRWTVVLRIFLAIPALFYVSILGFVVFFAVVAVWFAALFTARAPQGLAEFVGKVVQYTVRVNGYAYLLLTDKYPPWDLDADYAISVVLPPPGRLNRASVFFRLILIVPAGIVVQLLHYGLFPVMFFVWLIVLVSGRMPRAAWEALSVILRYETRFYAFASMLTSEYPRGLFGDKDAVAPAYAPPPLQEPMPTAPPVAPMPPAIDPIAAFEPGAQPRVGRFPLSRGGKRLVVLVIVLGVILGIGQVALSATLGNAGTAAELEDAYIRWDRGRTDWLLEVQRCATSGGLPCLNDAADELRADLVVLRSDLEEMDFPATTLGLAHEMRDTVDEMEGLLQIMATTSDDLEYNRSAGAFLAASSRLDVNTGVLYDELVF